MHLHRLMAPLTAIVVAGVPLLPASAAASPKPAAPYDFNGDGHPDVAVAAPGDDHDMGDIHVAFADPAGLRRGADLLDRAATLASGDFDADGYADLAAGEPSNEGVRVYYGRADGIGGSTRDQFLTGERRHSPPDPDDYTSDGYDAIGNALAVGDFNGDGFADLAIGVPARDVTSADTTHPGTQTDAGELLVRYGSTNGLYSDASIAPGQYERWTEDSAGVDGGTETLDYYGTSLAAADLDGDGIDDLVAGIPGKDVSGQPDAGAVSLLLGTPDGLTVPDTTTYTLDSPEVRGTASHQQACDEDDGCEDYGEHFGSSVAAGNLNGDRYADVVVGVPDKAVVARQFDPNDDNRDAARDGALSVLYGGAAGFAATSRFVTLNTPHVPGRVTDHSDLDTRLGATVAIGDVDGDGIGDIAAGAPVRRVAGAAGGSVLCLRGTANGVTTRGAALLSEGDDGVPNKPGSFDGFGGSLLVVDVSGDGRADLLVGAPAERVAGAYAAGAVFVVPGSARGVHPATATRLTERSTGFRGSNSIDDRFGTVGPLAPGYY